MTAAEYVILFLGGMLACLAACRWERVSMNRSAMLSLFAGAVCGLAGCMDARPGIRSAACLLFLAVYMALVMRHVVQPGKSMLDTVAAASIACGCFGMVRVLVGALLGMETISFFFRVMLAVVFLAGAIVAFGKMTRTVPQEGWQQYFYKEVQNQGKRLDRRGLLFPAFGICLALPAVTAFTLTGAILEFFAFWAGLELAILMVAERQGQETVLTEKQYRDDMQTYMSVIRSQRHDYNFHVQTLHGLLLQKDYEGCEKYVAELLGDSVAMNRLLPIKDAAVSALILSFQNKAAQEGIELGISVENDMSMVVTNVYETNKIVGNLLQNALDETERLPDKSYGIRLVILKRGEYCMIRVSNRTFRENPMKAYRAGQSSKAGHEGIGIASVQALAAKYGGAVYSRMEGDVIHFVAKIPLRLVKEAV